MIFLWTEGGQGIGLGHVRRCLVIALELRKQKNDVLFLINHNPSAAAWIKKEGFDFKTVALSETETKNIGQNDTVLIDIKKMLPRCSKNLKSSDAKRFLLIIPPQPDCRLML
jgi:spore coat polysaccharide biosynthesis predicted glycosyltransferase SpsG